MRFVTFYFRVEEYIWSALADALAIDPNIFLESLSDKAVSINLYAGVSLSRCIKFFGFGRILFGCHVDRCTPRNKQYASDKCGGSDSINVHSFTGG